MSCAGSVRESDGLPNRAGKAAEDGTEVHAMLAFYAEAGGIIQGQRAQVGDLIPSVGQVTDAQADAVNMVLDYIASLEVDGEWLSWSEKRLDIPEYMEPPEPMYGTPDWFGYDPHTKTLHIVDLKYGMMLVDVVDNEQFLYYAVMAIEYLRAKGPKVEQVILTVVQPRVSHQQGPVRSWAATMTKVRDFAGELLAKAADTQDPNAPLVAGDWCVFCRAAPHCPALRERAQEIAQQEFPIVVQDVGDSTGVVSRSIGVVSRPPEPKTLPTEVLADIGRNLPVLTIWAGAIEEEIERRMKAGEDVPGFAWADKRAWRQWKDEREAERVLGEEVGFDEESDFIERKLKSPAQIEKIVGKKVMKEKLADYITKGTPGKKVVRVGNPEALPSAQDEFPSPPSETDN